jgi:outer membrane protein assembly factor BamB
MRSPVRAFIPVGLAAAAIVAAACTPPPTRPPINPGSSTTVPTGPTTTTTTVVTGPPHLYAAKPVNSWGHDGIAYSVDIQGNAVYVGGDFAHAEKGNQSMARANVMAVQRDTGDLLPGFVANTDGIVHSVLSDGTSVYIGGEFTTINGVAKSRLAKVDAVTGAVDPSFTANAPNFVSDLLLWGNKLYVVGEFGQINGVARKGAALVDKATGAVDPTFDPAADLRVNTVAMNPAGTKLYLGGVFQSVGGSGHPWLTEVNPTTGKVQGPVFSTVQDYVRDVTVGPDGLVYAAVGGKQNSAYAFDPTTGRQKWREHANGDVQAVKYSNGFVFFGFHDGFTINGVRSYTLRILAANPQTGVLNPGFMPESGAYPGVLTIDADGSYLAAGGYFGRMGGESVHGLSIHP